MNKYFILSVLVLVFSTPAFASETCEEVETPEYVGSMCDGEYHGQGARFSDDGRKFYDGEFSQGEFHGKGTYYYVDGRLEGTFVEGKLNGPGRLILDNGLIQFVGTYKDNHKDGYGVMKFSDGGVYEGQFKKSLFHGKGTFKFKREDGESFEYVGDFKWDKFHGKGSLKSGDYHYEGEFARGTSNGFGKFTTSPVTEEKIIEKYGENYARYSRDLTHSNPVSFEGEFKGGNMHGMGRVVYSNGDTYEGEFKNKQPIENDKHFDKDGNPSNRHLISIKAPLPKMPHNATKSGHCVVNFDVDAEGVPENIEIESCSEPLFRKKSIKNIEKSLFYSKMENGVAVPRRNWRKKIHFFLTDERGRHIPELGAPTP